jgi:two-component system, OmpR family, response regulator QseB
MRVLIIEDDSLLGDGLASGLKGLGFAVDWFRDTKSGARAMESAPYDALILDLGLPGEDGMTFLDRLRANGATTPVLVLTARDAVASRIAGLDSGADDYLVKPVALQELAARLRAITRRARGRPEPTWRHGALEYNPASKSVIWNGEPVVLTSRELALLELLLANPDRVMSKTQILEKMYSWGDELESNAIEVFVYNLRRKIAPEIVRTVRGVGYALGGAAAAKQSP